MIETEAHETSAFDDYSGALSFSAQAKPPAQAQPLAQMEAGDDLITKGEVFDITGLQSLTEPFYFRET